MDGPAFHERVFIAGPTESGKSELLNVLFSGFRCQRVLVDTKGHEWSIDGVEPVEGDPSAIDWREPVIHYVTASTEVGEIDELFQRLTTRRDLVVAVHELGDLCGYVTQRTPESVNRYLAQGGAKGRGFLGATQLMVDMPKRARTEVQHAYVMVPPMDLDHLRGVCRMVEGASPERMRSDLDEHESECGPYSFIHYPKGARREPTWWPPLPDHLRAEAIVRRHHAHAGAR